MALIHGVQQKDNCVEGCNVLNENCLQFPNLECLFSIAFTVSSEEFAQIFEDVWSPGSELDRERSKNVDRLLRLWIAKRTVVIREYRGRVLRRKVFGFLDYVRAIAACDIS